MPSVKAHDRLVRLCWGTMDGTIWVAAVVLATWLRLDFSWNLLLEPATWLIGLAVALGHVLIGAFVGPYRAGHVRGSYEEVVDLVLTAAVSAALLMASAIVLQPVFGLPRSVPVIAGFIAVTLMMCTRFVVRSLRRHKTLRKENATRVIVFGAGRGGRLLVRNLLADPSAEYLPVAVLDDNPYLRKRTLDGIRVRGTRKDIARVAEDYDAEMVVIAIPSADGATLREISDLAMQAGVRTKVVPPMHSLLGQQPTARDIRDLNLEDLLGRRRVTLDQTAISRVLTGKRVLVTGAGGSIGSELARQIHAFGPAQLVLLDRDESALQAVQLDLAGNGLLDSDNLVLADIRDAETLQRVFNRHRPEVVFHAAALKHLPLLERYPLEAWKSNVVGTRNVLQAAENSGVQTFVNISTDKAADPTCVLGYSKRVAERLTAQMAQRSQARYMSVRFGNVLGSRGSVIPAFTSQIRHGGPVTVTHPDVERYFMLIPEACQLVMQAAVIGDDGEVMVLDMGEPVKIVHLAKTLIQMSGRTDVRISYTGLRPGEKMSEDLFNATDLQHPTSHPLVASVAVPALDWDHTTAEPLGHTEAADRMSGLATGKSRQPLSLVPQRLAPVANQ